MLVRTRFAGFAARSSDLKDNRRASLSSWPAGRLQSLLIALLAAAVIPFFVNLDDASIWDANEAYYVETPREMIESGDYINPSFNYEPRFNKPVLSYWIVAGLYRLFGVSVAVERAAITAAAMVMLVAVWFIARAASAQPLAPLLAALGLAAGPRFFMFSRRIFVDMAVTALMTLTLLFFVLAERYPSRRRLFLMLMYVSVGLGVLTKGPIAAAIPLLVFTTYLGVHREFGRLREMMIPTGALIALAVAAPWYVLLYMQHGWTHITAFFIGENIGRFTETIGVQAREWHFYIPVLLSDTLPWSLCLPAVVMTWWADRRRDGQTEAVRIRTLLLLWIAIIVVFFSLSQTKQDLYIFPVVAAVAALGGDWVARGLSSVYPANAGHHRGGGDRLPRSAEAPARRREPDSADGWFRWTFTVFGVVMALLGLGVLYLFSGDRTVYIDGGRAAAMIAIVGGLAVAILPGIGRRALAVSAALLVFIAFNWILAVRSLPDFERYKPVVPLSRVIAQRATPADVVAHFEVALPSMVYYLRRHIEGGLDENTFTQLLRSGRRVFAVLPADRYAALKDGFGVETCVVGRHLTSDIRLRSLLEKQPPPEVLAITNRCPAP
jgi:4-amino-4-deoxy-L-arabinose transferase-like glycosyltransferase